MADPGTQRGSHGAPASATGAETENRNANIMSDIRLRMVGSTPDRVWGTADTTETIFPPETRHLLFALKGPVLRPGIASARTAEISSSGWLELQGSLRWQSAAAINPPNAQAPK